MKKFTLLLVAVMCAIAANVRAIDFTLTSANEITKDGITITFDKGTGSAIPAWQDAGLRLYANNTITITATEDITEIVFNWEQQGNKAFATASANAGNYTHPTEAGAGTWTNGGSSVKSVVFTVGSSGQLQLNTLSVTLDNSGSVVTPDPDPEKPETGKEVTVAFIPGTDKAEGTSLSKNGVTLTATTFNNASYYQTYKSQIFTASVEEGYITSVVFTCTKNGTAKYGPGCYTLNGTDGEYSYESNGNSGTWTGNAKSVSLTASSNQVRMTKIEVTYVKPATTTPVIISQDVLDFGTVLTTLTNTKELVIEGENLTEAITATLGENSNFTKEGTLTEEGGTLSFTLTATEEGTYTETLTLSANGVNKEVTLQAVLARGTGEGTKEKPFTVEDVITMGSTLATAWVKGYIVGCVSNDGIVTTSADYKNSNLALGSDTEGTLYLAVQLPNNEARAALNLVDNATNLGKEVLLYGKLEAYFLHAGLKEVTEYVIDSTPTAIDNAAISEKAVKMIENGQLVIIREGVKYNAQGVRL